MRSARAVVLWVGFCLAGLVPGAWGQGPPAEEALVRLGTHLEKVRAEVRSGRLWEGGLLVGTGVVTGAVGIAGAFWSYPGNSGVDPELRMELTLSSALAGGLYAGTGLLFLCLKDEKETMPERFLDFAEETPEQKALKVVAGEVTLQGLADRGRSDRFLTAGLTSLAGAALVGLATPWATVGGDKEALSPLTDPGLYAGSGLLIAALYNLLVESTPERENRAYLGWKASVDRP